jgi:uncharacterized protein (DUF302 family)
MKYYFSKILNAGFDESIARTRQGLQIEGFGVISEIDMQAKLKEKLGVEFKKYTILGACIPAYAYKALQLEEKIGTMLPCNIVIVDRENGTTEVAAIHPVASMMAVENPTLEPIAREVSEKLERVIQRL